MARKITKPQQAASASTVDRLETRLKGALTDANTIAGMSDVMEFKTATDYRRFRDALARIRSSLRGMLLTATRSERR